MPHSHGLAWTPLNADHATRVCPASMCRSTPLRLLSSLSYGVMLSPMRSGSTAAGRTDIGILTSRLYPPPAYAWLVATSLVPTHTAVEATCTPGAFGASATVFASGP